MLVSPLFHGEGSLLAGSYVNSSLEEILLVVVLKPRSQGVLAALVMAVIWSLRLR